MKFSIVKHRKWWFTLSTLLVVASIVSIVMNGFNFGIDYTGGTILDLRFGKAVTVSEVRQVLDTSDMNLDNSVIQLTGVTEGDSSQDVMIRMRNLSSDETKALADKFSTQLGSKAHRIGRCRHRGGSHEKCRDQPGRRLYCFGGVYIFPL